MTPLAGMKTTSCGRMAAWPGHGTRPSSQCRGSAQSLLQVHTLVTAAALASSAAHSTTRTSILDISGSAELGAVTGTPGQVPGGSFLFSGDEGTPPKSRFIFAYLRK